MEKTAVFHNTNTLYSGKVMSFPQMWQKQKIHILFLYTHMLCFIKGR